MVVSARLLEGSSLLNLSLFGIQSLLKLAKRKIKQEENI